MKTLSLLSLQSLTLVVALLASAAARAQEFLPREEALRYAFTAALHEPPAAQLPLKVDTDLKRPVVGYEGEYGVLLLPETKLTAAALEAARTDVVPLGQIWLKKLTPLVQGAPADASQLLMVSVRHDGESARVPLCVLGARRSASGGLELLVYGKASEPLVRVPLVKAVRTQSLPIEISAERDYDSGRLNLHIAGQYTATIPVTELAD